MENDDDLYGSVGYDDAASSNVAGVREGFTGSSSSDAVVGQQEAGDGAYAGYEDADDGAGGYDTFDIYGASGSSAAAAGSSSAPAAGAGVHAGLQQQVGGGSSGYNGGAGDGSAAEYDQQSNGAAESSYDGGVASSAGGAQDLNGPQYTRGAENAHVTVIESEGVNIFVDEVEEEVSHALEQVRASRYARVRIGKKDKTKKEAPTRSVFEEINEAVPEAINLPPEDKLSIFDVPLVAYMSRPWEIVGADVSDYFNFGFNVSTWTQYSARQR